VATGVDWDHVPTLLSSNAYREWTNEAGRLIQAPIGWMNSVHSKLARLFARIELPDYVYSQRGRSYVDNGREHAGIHPAVRTDINKFYPSVTRDMVFRMFRDDLQCAADVAARLADICCFQQVHLPTGSPLSGRVAFFAAKAMFDEVEQLASRTDCTLTVYVDDIVLSGSGATKTVLAEMRGIIAKHGLKSKASKSKTYAANAAKSITGTVVVGDSVRLPNVRHRLMREARIAAANRSAPDREGLIRQLRGREIEAAQFRARRNAIQPLGSSTQSPESPTTDSAAVDISASEIKLDRIK